MWTQVSTVNPNAQAYAGSCLAFVQQVFGAPVMYKSAWESWEANGSKHGTEDAMPVNQGVSFPLYFSHYGTYGEPPEYGNWGHVVAYIPGIGYLSSPGAGYGQEVLQSIDEIERRFNCKWVGWAEALNDMQVILYTPEPTPVPVEPTPAPVPDAVESTEEPSVEPEQIEQEKPVEKPTDEQLTNQGALVAGIKPTDLGAIITNPVARKVVWAVYGLTGLFIIGLMGGLTAAQWLAPEWFIFATGVYTAISPAFASLAIANIDTKKD